MSETPFEPSDGAAFAIALLNTWDELEPDPECLRDVGFVQRLLARHGLFEVAKGVWQVRGFDAANATFIAGKTGWVVIDPLTSVETAKAALDLANETLGARPVVADALREHRARVQPAQ